MCLSLAFHKTGNPLSQYHHDIPNQSSKLPAIWYISYIIPLDGHLQWTSVELTSEVTWSKISSLKSLVRLWMTSFGDSSTNSRVFLGSLHRKFFLPLLMHTTLPRGGPSRLGISLIYLLVKSQHWFTIIREMKYNSQHCCNKTMDCKMGLNHECCFLICT